MSEDFCLFGDLNRSTDVESILISTASAQNGDVLLNEIFPDTSRICFNPSGFSQYYFRETFGDEANITTHSDDSNRWYIGFLSADGHEAQVFGISNSAILWNDYASPEILRITDPEAEPGCHTRATIIFDEGVNSLVFSLQS